MKELESLFPKKSQLLLVAGLVMCSLALAGCTTTEDYSASVSEPTNGTVIQNLSVYDINEMDGARYELKYRLNNSHDVNYTIKTYERTNGSYELITTSLLTGREQTYKNDLPPPWDPGVERIYRLEVVRTDTGIAVDKIMIILRRDGG